MSRANEDDEAQTANTLASWIRKRWDGLQDEVIAFVVLSILGALGGLVLLQFMPTVTASPLFYPVVGVLCLLVTILVIRHRVALRHLFFRQNPPKVTPTEMIDGVPITEPRNFYGRTEHCRQFFELVMGTQVLSISVLGVRRSGKTSFLNMVKHQKILERYNLDRSKYLFTFLDLENSMFETPDCFYNEAINRVYAELPQLSRVPMVPPRSGNPADDFGDLVRALSHCDFRLIFLLDEIEHLVSLEAFTEVFFLHLRSLVVDGNVGWVTTSYRPLSKALSSLGMPASSPFFNIFHTPPMYLGALDEGSCNKLMNKPFERNQKSFIDEEARFLRALAGRLPYWIQVATESYWECCKDITYRDQTKLEQLVTAEFGWRMATHFERYWNQFEAEERTVLSALITKSQVRNARRNFLIESHGLLADLQRYGIVEQTGEGFKICSSAFANWIGKNAIDSRLSARR